MLGRATEEAAVSDRPVIAPGFQTEIRIPASWVAGSLIVMGLVVVMAANAGAPAGPVLELLRMSLGLVIIVAALICLRLEQQGHTLGRWAMIGLVVIIVLWANRMWTLPGSLALLAIPTALATAFLGPAGGLVTALGASAVVAAWSSPPQGDQAAFAAVPLVAIWSLFLVMFATLRPIEEVANEAWRYYEEARDWVEDARNRKLELQQALVDLADANRQLTRLNIMAQDLRHTAEEARSAKEQFVSNVSHELRTPLNMIIGFSELILQAPKTYGRKIPPALLADLVVIKRNAEHLADLVDDVLDLSQVETEQIALAKEHVAVEDIIDKATTAVRPLYDSKGLYLREDVSTDLPPLFCDPTRIREVVLNLLSNAGRFTERGGVEVCARRDGNDVIVSVADTGPGIAPSDMPRLFQPFEQLDTSIRRRYGGTGLGLSISKRFVELHEGKIWAESTLGAGTTFFFRLPITAPVLAETTFTRWLSPEWEYRQRTRPSRAPIAKVNPRFVVVDGNESLTRLLARYMHDVELVSAPDLEQAAAEVQRVPAQAMLLNDHSVPQALASLYTCSSLPDSIPIIACAVPGIAEATAALGASDYLVKPIARDALLGSMERMGVQQGTVLIVDDEPDAAQLFRRMLVTSGRDYRVFVAQDAQEALAISHEYHPAVILLDLIMPNMDGFQFLRSRGEDPGLRGVPIIIISAQDPAGQPIISEGVAVTRRGGLSARQLLTMIRFLTETPWQTEAAAPDQPAGRAPTAESPG